MKDNNLFDKQLEAELKRKTQLDMDVKQAIWKSIEDELFHSITEHDKNRRGVWVAGISLAAVMLILLFGVMTETGQAMIQNLKDLFIEEKQEQIEMEGQQEELDTHLETNEELRYVIYLDDERYKMDKGGEADRIELKEELPDSYPDVYMEIRREENTTTEEVAADIKETLNNEEMEIVEEIRTKNPIEAELIRGRGSKYPEWDTPIYQYYVTDSMNGQVFVIKQAYFLEAAEGHGARFHYMLESFEIVK